MGKYWAWIKIGNFIWMGNGLCKQIAINLIAILIESKLQGLK